MEKSIFSYTKTVQLSGTVVNTKNVDKIDPDRHADPGLPLSWPTFLQKENSKLVILPKHLITLKTKTTEYNN